MKNLRGIDFLKLRAEGGILYYDGSMSANRDVDNYKWDSDGQKFGPHTNNQWFGSTTSNAGNPNHPRLTYNKVNNNYKTSTFWLEDGGFFKIQTVELGYELPVHRLGITSIRRMRVYLRGNNLCTISKIKDVDPEALSSGLTNYPLMRTFVAGIKLTF